MRKQPLPLLLLAGFLGSGKTSTLRNWLQTTTQPLNRIAVIINDFGEINVDAALLARRQLELTQITGGCVCCQSMDELQQQIVTLSENPNLDMVWIETSGLADPEEILDHLTAPQLQAVANVRRLILVVDATDYPCSWRGRAIQEEQIRYADLILLNKTDRLTPQALEKLTQTLKKVNPVAEIIPAKFGVVSPDILSDVPKVDEHEHEHSHDCGGDCHEPHHHHDHDHKEEAHAEHEHSDCCGHDHEHEHGHDHDHHHHHGHVDHLNASTHFLPIPQPLSRLKLEAFLGALPPAVFRAKGFIRLTESPETLFTVQKVRDQAELLLLPLELDPTAPALKSGLIFIGPHLPSADIEALAAHLLA